MEGTATSTGSTTTGPASFSDSSLTWSDASSASTPSPDSTTTASASADATVPPAESASTDGQPPASGEPPRERWDAILDNARKKASEEALSTYKQQYGWAEQFNQADIAEAVRIAQLAQRDPIAYAQELINDLQQHPVHGQQLRSMAARALAAARGQQPQAETEPQPDLPIQLEDGRVVHLYSAEQQAKREAYLQKQWLAQVDQRLQPIAKSHEETQAEKAALARQAEVTRYVDTTYQDVQTWPGMDDAGNRKAVAEALAQMRVDDDDPRSVSLALNAAYRQIVLPKLSQKAQSALLDDLKTKAAASTSVNPKSAAPSTAKNYSSFDKLPADMWR